MKTVRRGSEAIAGTAVIKNIAADWLRRLDWLLVGVLFLLFLPVVGVHKLIDFMIFTIFVLAYDLLYGFMGRLSFGHMLYLGTGAYAASVFSVYMSPNPFLSIIVALLAGAAIGAILGPIIVRATGSCFALINLAFNQVGYFLVLVAFAKYTGGEDGLSPCFSRIGSFDLYDPSVMFTVALISLILVFILVKKLTSSPFGILLKSIKENETRVKFLGYNTFVYKWITFIISTSLSAFAGCLWAMNLAYVTPSAIDPQRNVEIIFATLIGGPGSPYGALIGGSAYMAISNYLASYISRWEMFLGLALLILVFRFPKGIWGTLTEYMEKSTERRRLARL